ncbi:hypothetical protein ABBQ32_013990 [Trebouxia sp. C0010 RCD-2024]
MEKPLRIRAEASAHSSKAQHWKGSMQARGIQAYGRRKVIVCGLSVWSERRSEAEWLRRSVPMIQPTREAAGQPRPPRTKVRAECRQV